MRTLKFIFGCLVLCISSLCNAQEAVVPDIKSLTSYLDANPNCLTKEIIYEGCTLGISSDGEYLFGQFTILHPELQLRILMQGLTVYVDPTGKKKEKYAINFPAASAVQDVMLHMAPPSVSSNRNEDELPDISPLVNALSSYGAEFEINGKHKSYEQEWACITLDPESHVLSYSFILPTEELLKEKKLSDTWRMGLFSSGGNSFGDGPGNGPGMGAPGMGAPTRGLNPPKGKERSNDEKAATNLRKMMMKDIEQWTAFSFNEVCSTNQ